MEIMEFYKAVHVKDIKNNISTLSMAMQMISMDPNNTRYSEIISKRRAQLVKIYRDNRKRIIEGLHSYKNLENRMVFQIIDTFWNIHLPVLTYWVMFPATRIKSFKNSINVVNCSKH